MNTPNRTLDISNNLAEQAAHSADNAIRSTQRMANEALDGMAGKVGELRDQAAPLMSRASEQASAMAHRGMDAMRQGSQQLRDSAEQASSRTIGYIKDEPVKSMLIAAATGAALMALLSLVSHSRHRG
jgi:ElaB/YqjD/DUF883 family membrane-anchored ribosome-binding protein